MFTPTLKLLLSKSPENSISPCAAIRSYSSHLTHCSAAVDILPPGSQATTFPCFSFFPQWWPHLPFPTCQVECLRVQPSVPTFSFWHNPMIDPFKTWFKSCPCTQHPTMTPISLRVESASLALSRCASHFQPPLPSPTSNLWQYLLLSSPGLLVPATLTSINMPSIFFSLRTLALAVLVLDALSPDSHMANLTFLFKCHLHNEAYFWLHSSKIQHPQPTQSGTLLTCSTFPFFPQHLSILIYYKTFYYVYCLLPLSPLDGKGRVFVFFTKLFCLPRTVPGT